MRRFWQTPDSGNRSGWARIAFAATLSMLLVAALTLAVGLGRASIGGNGASASQYQYGPTSKSQCQHGGWENFSQFSNQGQCIQFVKSGG